MTLAERFEDVFRRGGVPFKECRAFGSHALFTFWSEDAARKAVRLLRAATFTTKGPVESVDYAKEQGDRKTLHPKVIRVWRVGARA